MTEQYLLETESLSKSFPAKASWWFGPKKKIGAVTDVSLSLPKGKTTGLIGESGCGKTTMGKLLIRLLKPTSGKIRFDGVDITTLPEKKITPMRKDFQMIFQNPYDSLNPRMTVRQIISEPLVTHGLHKRDTARRVDELLDAVALPRKFGKRYPDEFSGGQRQRIGIARALATEPRFIVADEPVAALDVSIQAQILNLLLELQKEFNLTYLFITHDLGVAQYICDRLTVMYLGSIAETGETDTVFNDPLHPYTRGLLSAVPPVDPDADFKLLKMTGELPSPLKLPIGCSFHPRCPFATERCVKEKPTLRETGGSRLVACHLNFKTVEK